MRTHHQAVGGNRSVSPWGSRVIAPAGRIIVQREPAAADTDGATAQTVRRMCEYIRAGVDDPECRSVAAYAWEHFGRNSDDAAAKCWAVWWWVKHCIKYRSDEATMFRIGEQGQQDLLIAPAVLVRMKDPAEDCDGFSMLVATLLTILGVNCVIATVAVDPSDRSRWSHVFCCALLPDGQVMPLDASHGKHPGWMVPAAHISRWQAWDLNARPVDVQPSQHQGLHGYARVGQQRRGMGSCATGDLVDEYDQPCYTGTVSSPPASGSNWNSFLQGLIQQGVTLTGKILTPPSYQQTTNAAGQITTIRSTTPTTALTAAAGSSSNILLIGGAVLAAVVIASSMKK